MATLPKMTLAQLRLATRQRCDFVNDPFVSEEELNSFLNESLFSLFDELVSAYGEDYYATYSDNYTTSGQADSYALPSDFYKLLGVDLQLTTSPNGWVTLKPFPMIERNRYSVPNTISMAGFYTNLRYRLRANNIWFTPYPVAGQVFRLLYVPRMTPLIDPVTVTVSSVQAGDFIEFEGIVSLTAVTTSPGTAEFAIGATDTVTAGNLVTAINANTDLQNPNYAVSATLVGNVVTIIQGEDRIDTLGLLTSNELRLSLAGSAQVSSTNPALALTTESQLETDGYSGWLEYVIVDAARKCLAKQQDEDVITFERDLERVRARIIQMAPDRDVGSPARVGDVYRTGNGWQGGWGDGGDGGGWG